MKTTVTIKKAKRRGYAAAPAKGFVMYGNTATADGWKWFERWFPTVEAAERHAIRKGWATKFDQA